MVVVVVAVVSSCSRGRGGLVVEVMVVAVVVVAVVVITTKYSKSYQVGNGECMMSAGVAYGMLLGHKNRFLKVWKNL